MNSKRLCNKRREAPKEKPVSQSSKSRDEAKVMWILDRKSEKLGGKEYEERGYDNNGTLVKRTLTKWAVTAPTTSGGGGGCKLKLRTASALRLSNLSRAVTRHVQGPNGTGAQMV